MAEHSHDGRPGRRDALEAELESFRPAPVSDELAARIGRQLGQEPANARRLTPGHRLLVIGLAAAACVVVAIRFGGERDDPPAPGPIALTLPAEPPTVTTDRALPPPSISAYQQALAKSPDALDALLDAHAPRLLRAAGGGGPRMPDSFQSSRTRHSTLDGETL